MKRHAHLYPKITSFENLLLAAHKAQKSKRTRPEVLQFNHHLESNLLQLQIELRNHTYEPGEYRNFEIYEPKPRWISAAPYRDRVVHHALCQIIQPIFEPSFIYDSYANRKDKGTHRALRRFTHFARNNIYVFQADIRRYFPNINHRILKTMIRRKINCPDTLWLIDRILANSPIFDSSAPEPVGIPIGNLTSQFFANIYLNGLDHYILDTIKPNGYVRYVDDFSLFSNDRDFLIQSRKSIESYVKNLHLEIHSIKSQIFETCIGSNFVGFRIFPDRIRIRNSNLRRTTLRFNTWKRYSNRDISQIKQSIASWTAHLNHGNTWKLRQMIQERMPLAWLN